MSSPRFSIIPAWIVTDSRLKGSDLKVLCLLGTYTNKEGWCRRSQVKMAEQLNCGRSTVQDSLNRLSEIGAVEKRRVESLDGRDSAHWYRVILDRATPIEAFTSYDEEEAEEYGPVTASAGAVPPAGTPAPPAGIPAPPAGSGAAPPAGSGPAPINDDSLTISSNDLEREVARDGIEDRSETPGAAAFEKRVSRLCNGDGFKEGEWKGWTSSTLSHIARQFASLTPQERHDAEQHRDALLAKCKREKVKPMPIANYLRDRAWLALNEQDKAAAAAHRESDRVPSSKPDGWVATYSPQHAAAYFRILLEGPEAPQHAPSNGVWLTMHLRQAWPRMAQFWQQSDLRGGVVVRPLDVKTAELMRFIPADSTAMAEWRAAFKAKGLPEPKVMERGGYFPAGDPEQAMADFKEAVARERGNDDAA